MIAAAVEGDAASRFCEYPFTTDSRARPERTKFSRIRDTRNTS